MTEKVEVVIVGGGVVGCSVLYGLARNGCTDTLLIEKNELTSGSTWHAAGAVTFFGHYASLTQLYVDSMKTYLEAEAETGQSVSCHTPGSLRLASSQREMDAYKALVPLYDEIGVPYAVLTPDEIAEAHPVMSIEGLAGAAHTPTDGHLDPSGATHAMAQGARARGARTWLRCNVDRIAQRAGGGWLVTTAKGEVECEKLVLANSFWAREMATQINLNLPLYAVEHHAFYTDSVPELAALGFEVPIVRDPHAPSNIRQEGTGFLAAVYEADPKFWAVDGIPPDFNGELFPPDIDRLDPHMERVMERVPAFARAGLKNIVNGAICYTPDGCPLLGPVEACPGLWLATGYCIGIGQGGGSGDFLARWMLNGEPPFDLPIVHPSRFSNDMSREACLAAIKETYASGYVVPEVG